MINKSFGPQYNELTPSGKPNYVWALKRYFNKISIDLDLKDCYVVTFCQVLNKRIFVFE